MKRLRVLLIVILICTTAPAAFSQCAMCRAGAESSIKQHKTKIGTGLNHGILYLMSIPYIIGGIAGLVWWRKKNVIKAFLKGN